ncbi:MAG: neuraminidase-like domain-containing protein [Candidatus Nitrotoga sp.]
MNKITFPLKQRKQGAAVADLQDALQLLLDRSVLLVNDEAARRQLSAVLKRERANQTYGAATSQLVSRFQQEHKLSASGEVDEPTAIAFNALLKELGVLDPPTAPAKLRSFVVKGQVSQTAGRPFTAGTVQVFDKDLRSEELLGESALDASGFYEVRYSLEQFRRAEKQAADLIVRILNLRREVLFSTDVIFNAAAVQTIDIVLTDEKRLSEFERHVAQIRPLLQELPFADLKEADIDFLAEESGIEPVQIAFLVVAHQHSTVTRIAPEIFYGLFRQDLPSHLPALLLQTLRALRGALVASIDDAFIPLLADAAIDAAIAALKRQMSEQLLRDPGGSEVAPRLLRAAGLNPEEQDAFLAAYLAHEGDIEAFWRSQRASSLAGKVQTLQATLQMGLVTLNNLPLVEALQTRNVRSLADIARLDRRELEQIITGSADILAAIPANDAAETAAQKATRTSEGIFEILHTTMPTAFVRAAYDKSPDPLRRDVARVLANAPQLELRDDHIDQFFADNPGALAGVANPETVKVQLKRVQRTLRVAPNAEHAEALMTAGLDSAQAVVSMAPAAFDELFADKFGGAIQTRQYYKKAKQVSATVLVLAAALKQSVQGASPGVIQPVAESVKALPNFTTLFGSQSLCACEHCGSVLSPAAYLVDLLDFLNPKSGQKPIAKLRQKRPDIEHIPLTCENTNTPLPYIDLVNEVLEFYVANHTLTAAAARDTQGMSAEELSINPQYDIDTAYQTLAATVYPHSLPFHRPLALARCYLEHLGANRHHLMQTFHREGQPSEADIDLEYLKISVFERNILMGDSGRPLAEFYGYPASQDPSTLSEIKVSDFLSRTGLTYEELIPLLATTFINPASAIKLVDDENPPRCDLTKTSLKNLTPDFWQKAHRFVRLQRKLGWSMKELDLAFTAFQATDITLELLRKLAVAHKLKADLRLPLNVLFSFWSDLDTTAPASLYAQLFLNKALLNPPDPAFAPGTAENSAALLQDHAPAVLAALRLSDEDFVALRAHLGLADAQTTLSLANLSALHRQAVLARALKLKVPELLVLQALTSGNPFIAADPVSTQQFTEIVRLIRGASFSIAHLNYLYRHQAGSADSVAPSAEAMTALFSDLQTGLQQITVNQGPAADQSDPLIPGLSLALGDAEVEQALAVIYGTPPLTDAERSSFIDKQLARFLDPAEAKVKLLDPAATKAVKQEYVQAELVAFQRKSFVTQTLSDLLGLAHAVTDLLLRKILKSETNPAKGVVYDFLSLSALPETIPETALAAVGRAFVRLHKAGLLLKGFGVSDRELEYLSAHGADFGDFDFNALPLSEAEVEPTQFQQWQGLARLFAFRNSLPPSQTQLVEVFEAATSQGPNPRQAAIAQLKNVTGWSAPDIALLVGPTGFDLSTAEDFRNETKLVPLLACIQLSQRLGIACERLFAWASAEPDAASANDIVHTVKAKYSEERWLTVAKPINDTLRENQRRALVSYVLANDAQVKQAGITHSNQLFEYFLIDVEMGACMNTSRIKQAISSVQLFIQRCLMNLEEGFSPSAIDADRWHWMKNYRVWEANRKVFLYPENWIEPELRDDKSPFFRELETELLQNDLTLATAEQAFVHYLEKLDQVAQLEICGLYVQEPQEWGDEEVVHVFGRTKATPRVYFYRQFLNGRTWTPWEKIEMDIEGDHLVPVVHNRRLYLFWLHFEEKQDTNQQLPHAYIQSEEHWRWLNKDYPDWKSLHSKWSKKHPGWELWKRMQTNDNAGILGLAIGTMKTAIESAYAIDDLEDADGEPPEPRKPEEPPFSAPPPLTHWEITLEWSEYKDGRWSAKETSVESITSPHVTRSLGKDFAESNDNNDKQIIPAKVDGTYDNETIFSIFLPDKQRHFVRAETNRAGQLILNLFRRFKNTDTALGHQPEAFQGYSKLGEFELHCGNKVKATSAQEFILYESLKRPWQTENEVMSFQHRRYTFKALTFIANGKVRHILTNLPGVGDFGLLYEHQRAQFRLKPPFQSFFFQDQSKTYFASWFDDSPALVITNSDQAQLAIGPKNEAQLVSAINLQIGSASAKKRNFPGARVLVTQTSNQMVSAPPSSSASSVQWMSAGSSLNTALALVDDTVMVAKLTPQKGLKFETFFHPHVCEFIERLYRSGIPALLSRDTQELDNDATPAKNLFVKLYEPTAQVAKLYPREHVDFGHGAYASYNWELFFHIPMLIATALTKNQRFEDALPWYHFIFNPTTDDATTSRQRYWNTLPFYENTHPEKEQIQHMLLALAGHKPGWKEIEAQIEASIADPFNPHLIARLRLTAYQKNVVMKYIDNLIAWADQLFSRDTIEAINEATLLYVLAYNILGPRPKTIAAHTKTEPKAYKQIEGDLDAFGNALVEVENIVPYKGSAPALSWKTTSGKATTGGDLGKSAIQSLYFCVPKNAEMLRYWDTVDDRLFKIRHCMNIEGGARQLPLFEPPIDPALLVRARAAGVDLGSVLNDLFAPVPHYRFNVLLQKALELCNELKSLGGALLSALEKKDAEALSNLRATQETTLLKAIREVKRQQIEETKANIEALNRTRLVTEARYSYYRDIERISANEQNQMDSLSMAHSFNLASQSLQAAAGVAFYLPNFQLGSNGPFPVSTLTFGGTSVGQAIQTAAAISSMIAAGWTHDAAIASIVGGYERRWDEWKLQETLTRKELDQIDKQIVAAEIRQAITAKELDNHEQQIANSVAVEEFLRGKYTNEDLYGWMTTQVSKVYFQAYKLATDLSKRAERTYRHELGVQDSSFIQFGYWDSLKKGLLAGEQLTLDLKRLEAAYLNQNKREYELTKHVSLLQVDPMELIKLRETGRCTVALREELFDMDGPGHYFRRIKSVAVSIPCVTGPYTSVNCTLTLLKSSIRKNSQLHDGIYVRENDEDDRFIRSFGSVQTIVTSSAQSDSGLFEANLSDERYLPFEYSGAISEWQLELPADVRQFDYNTISDVILHIRYTAREGGELLRNGAVANLAAGIEAATVAGSVRLFSVRHEFPTEWAKFQSQASIPGQRFELAITLRPEHYPFWSQGRLNSVLRVELLARSTQNPAPGSLDIFDKADQNDATGKKDTLAKDAAFANLLVGELTQIGLPASPVSEVKIFFVAREIGELWVAVKWGQ